ncbi:unnamed protein product [Orchesella dallaii]|uniref:Uncharacterized protein n=1 Tax=Orchesella dallaii TaxID=48710 RepID=A0ABP1S774_9HEXA
MEHLSQVLCPCPYLATKTVEMEQERKKFVEDLWVSFYYLLFFLLRESNSYINKSFSSSFSDSTNSTAAPPGNKTCRGGHKGKPRGKRDIGSDIEKQLKEFGKNLGKSNDEMMAAFTKFVNDNGLTIEEIVEAFKQGGDVAQNMITKIQKAIVEG